MASQATTETLALNGGTPVRTTPLPARHMFGEEEKAAAVRLFDQSIQTGDAFGYNGEEEQAYEKEFAALMGGGFADGVNSGTNAVFVALGALQLPAGSEVIVPPITDPGGVMPVVLLNCIPIFADSAPGFFNMGAEQFEAAITPNTRAVVVAHIAGEPAEIDRICDIARAKNIKIVEDCAQAHLARYKGQYVGTFGDIAAFSTMFGKHFATGGQGGAVFTKNEDLYWNARRFADRGKPFNIDGIQTNVIPALNCNLNDLSAAIGREQLRKLPASIARRRAVGEGVKEGLADCKAVSVGKQLPDSICTYWFFRIHVDLEKLSCDKDTFVQALRTEGIYCAPDYRHIPAEAEWVKTRKETWCPWAFGQWEGTVPELKNAVDAATSHITIACHEGMGEAETRDIVAALKKVEAAYLC